MSAPDTTPEDARETVAQFVERRNVQMSAHFRGAGPAAGGGEDWKDPRATHWGITLAYGGRQMFADYHMGAAYWRWKRSGEWGRKGERVAVPHRLRNTLWEEEKIRNETEPMPPEITDVLDCLRSDAQSYDNARGFEDWCGDFGYDTDSRKAEATYRACGEIYRKLETLFGRDVLRELFETEPE